MNTKHTDEYPLSTLEPFIFIPKEHYDQLIRLCEDLEPLRREVAMLHRCLELYPQHFHDVFNPESECEICAARTSTQSTALAYEREVKAKALEESAIEFETKYSREDKWIGGELRIKAAELRASKGKVKNGN